MKMNDFIARLKQQPRIGGFPPFGLPAAGNAVTQIGVTPAAAAVTNQVQQLAQQLANQMVAEMQQTQVLARNGRTYTKFDAVNDVVGNQTETVTAGLWRDCYCRFME